MHTDVLTDTPALLIRRLCLDPGEAMYWHVDICRRFSVVVSGSLLGIEFEDSGEVIEIPVNPGLAGWDEPEQRRHRAINLGDTPYEEVVTFYRNTPSEEPQPAQPDPSLMPADTAIRLYRESDRAQVVQLWKTNFPDDPHWNEPDMVIDTKLQSSPGAFFVFEHAGQVTGTVITGFDGVRGWIHKLSVSPEFQGQGFARRLMLAAEHYLALQKCPKVNLQVRDTNSAVIRFYERLGYQVEARASMGKRLNPPS